MTEISIFLANHYIWFIIIDILLLFALVGYFLDAKNKKNDIEQAEVLDTIKYEEPIEDIEELTMQMGDKANKSLNSLVNSVETLDDQQNEVETLK